jgi:hypothetical protein
MDITFIDKLYYSMRNHIYNVDEDKHIVNTVMRNK